MREFLVFFTLIALVIAIVWWVAPMGGVEGVSDRVPLSLPLKGRERLIGDRVRALLVGVQEYPKVKEHLEAAGRADHYARRVRLRGPANDVWLMDWALRHQLGFEEDEIGALVSGGLIPPTRENVLASLDRMAEVARAGVLAVVYFAGHGTRVPDRDGDESDGLDEMVLTEDAAGWEERSPRVRGGILDDEIGEKVARIRRRGARVWLIVDSCHSGTVLRGARRQAKPRRLPAGVFGVREQAESRKVTAAREHEELRGGLESGVVVMTAAAPNQTAVELELGKGRQWHGLFTYCLVQQLVQRAADETFGELYQKLCTKLAAQGRLGHRPHISGDQSLVIATGEPLRQRHFVQATAQGWFLDAGDLHAIEDGFEFSVFGSGHRGDEASQLGTVRAVEVGLHKSRIEALPPSPGFQPLELTKSMGKLPADLSRSVVRSHAIRTAFQRGSEATSLEEARVFFGPEFPWIVTDWPEFDAPSGGHDAIGRESPEDWALPVDHGDATAFASLVPLDKADWIVVARNAHPSDEEIIQLREAASGKVVRSFHRYDLAHVLFDVYRATNLLRLGTRGSDARLPDGIDVSLQVDVGERWVPLRDAVLRPGTHARLVFRNSSGQDWDVYAFSLSSNMKLQRLFPWEEHGQTIAREEEVVIREGLRFTDNSLGSENVLIVVVPQGSPSLANLGDTRDGVFRSIPTHGLGGILRGLLLGRSRGGSYFSAERRGSEGGLTVLSYRLDWGELGEACGGIRMETKPFVASPARVLPSGFPNVWSIQGTLAWFEEGLVSVLLVENEGSKALFCDLDVDSNLRSPSEHLASAFSETGEFDFELAVMQSGQERVTYLDCDGDGVFDHVVVDLDEDPWGDVRWLRSPDGEWNAEQHVELPWPQFAPLRLWTGKGFDKFVALHRFFVHS